VAEIAQRTLYSREAAICLGEPRFLGRSADGRSAVYGLPGEIHRMRLHHRAAGRLIALLILGRALRRG
jgi:hypothetical protein